MLNVNNETEPSLPTEVRLDQNYPNPFSTTTHIRYAVPEPALVEVTVYDVMGRVVHTIVDKHHAPGNYEIGWPGRDRQGWAVPAGLYVVRARIGDEEKTRTMVKVE